MKAKIHLLVVKINEDFNFNPYLKWFNNEIINKIKKYRFRKDQVTAFVSELIKKYYLADYLSISPDDIKFTYNSYGKPFIDNSYIDFNISHSGEFVAVAITSTEKIGIDIQEINNISLSKKYLGIFSHSESTLINNINQFLLLWTKKEAYLKAIGCGFTDSSFYKKTTLNLSYIEDNQDYLIITKQFLNDYNLSLCIAKKEQKTILYYGNNRESSFKNTSKN